MNHKESSRAATHCPQPAFLTIASWPAGFIGMRRLLTSDVLGSFVIRLLKCTSKLGFAVTQAAKTHRHRENLVHHSHRLTLAGIKSTCEYPNYRQYARSEVSAFDFIRQWLIDKCAAFATLEYMLDILNDFRQKLSEVRLVAVPCPAFSMPMPWQFGRHSGWVGGWRLGRIPRIHPQKPFKLFYTFFQLDNLVFQLLYICVFVHKAIIGQKQTFTSIT